MNIKNKILLGLIIVSVNANCSTFSKTISENRIETNSIEKSNAIFSKKTENSIRHNNHGDREGHQYKYNDYQKHTKTHNKHHNQYRMDKYDRHYKLNREFYNDQRQYNNYYRLDFYGRKQEIINMSYTFINCMEMARNNYEINRCKLINKKERNEYQKQNTIRSCYRKCKC